MMTENALSYIFFKNYCDSESRVFFKFLQNSDVKRKREWTYWCAPEVDVIEVKKDGTVIGYELKADQRRKSREEGPALFKGIDQAIAYLDLPRICENGQEQFKEKFEGGAFDFVYVVYTRQDGGFSQREIRTFNLLPIGVILVSPRGECKRVKEAPANPLLDSDTKNHFLNNLDTLKNHSVDSRIFSTIKLHGEAYLSGLG
ncbi:MAG: hypothetical protein L0196_08565 [candidate division Zixibacteria bacterium]|nr:hypothetical protein [candidate division Zixibacteria bacterium]